MHSCDPATRRSLATGTVLALLLYGCGPEPVATGTGASTTNAGSSGGSGPTPTEGGPSVTSTSQVSTSSSADTTTGSATVGPDMGAASCVGEVVGNPSCGGATPYCVDDECVGCALVDCAALDPSRPVCSD